MTVLAWLGIMALVTDTLNVLLGKWSRKKGVIYANRLRFGLLAQDIPKK